ncbi:nucleoside hydrolase [Pseudoalteromonas citrea]|uniref:Nucleoside hydrolase n=1 Tax=Pseudoalteromonas citrea TaxID=43655 RepID=A0A5S3XP92_9GAMM|nr:nucleoside hydrolase [Pseudoalteromonas citrea]TMP40311.1 nucleoside hydrolase [Pseudoalteromonas citrea]TMP56940.1 nucleoside hydrolase [Pseudoalteromonas citrea]
MKKIIIDTDPGIDDAMAILLAHASNEIDLVGITTTFGNTSIENSTRNALYLKDKFALQATVAQGVDVPLVLPASPPATAIHGNNGLGNINIPSEQTSQVINQLAHDYIINTVKAHPHEITLIAIGRLTNLALALSKAPEIASLVKEVIIMGGAFGFNGHSGNLTPFAEANVYGDPHAADIVVSANWPVTMVGLDVTQQSIMSTAYINDLKSKSSKYGAFIYDISEFYAKFYHADLGLDGFYVHDASAIIYAIAPELFTTRKGNIRVVTEGVAEGQTLFKESDRVFPIDEWSDRPKQKICTNVECDKLLNLYYNTMI